MVEKLLARSAVVLLACLILGIGGTLDSCSFIANLSKKTSQDTPPVIYPPVDDNKAVKPDKK